MKNKPQFRKFLVKTGTEPFYLEKSGLTRGQARALAYDLKYMGHRYVRTIKHKVDMMYGCTMEV